MSRLRDSIRSGHSIITAEIVPPLSAAPDALLREAATLGPKVDAVNVTDAAAGRTTMSSFASAALLADNGYAPILQVTCRDRNRIALAGDLHGTSAQGIRNMLPRGDDPKDGDQPAAKPVFDFETADLMPLAHDMRDRGELPSGRKIEFGAGFIQTQFCFDLEVARQHFSRLGDENITGKVGIIIGVGPIRSTKSARWMNDNLFGVHVPEATIERLEGAENRAAAGRANCVELIEGLPEMQGPAGAQLMAPMQGPDAIAAVPDALSF